jgi:hypothetical protein
MQTLSVLLHVEGTAAEIQAVCNEALAMNYSGAVQGRDSPSMTGSSGQLPPLFGRVTKRKPKEGPSDLCVFHTPRSGNDERASETRDELLISLTRPRGGVFGFSHY